MKKISAFLFIAILFSGCAERGQGMAIIGNTYPPYNGPVQIFWENDLPKDLDYEKIGYVSAKCWSGKRSCDWTHVYMLMQERAARYGANGIIIKVTEKDPYSEEESNTVVIGRQTLKEGFALAIRLKGASEPPMPLNIGPNADKQENGQGSEDPLKE